MDAFLVGEDGKKMSYLKETVHPKLKILSLAMFPPTYFYAHFGISHNKTLDGNAKMRINSKNVHKKNVYTQLSRINFLSDKEKCA